MFNVFVNISKKCRYIVPTPCGSILLPPRASQVRYNANTSKYSRCYDSLSPSLCLSIFLLIETPNQPELQCQGL